MPGIMILLFLASLSFSVTGQIVINEFAASNSNTKADPDFNDYSDWVEFYNRDTIDWNLKNFYLTDNFDTPDKWQIPEDIILSPGDFALIWADGLNTGLHSSFKISASGEELALFSPGGRLIDSLSFSVQQADVSYGRISDGHDSWGYFPLPTPGSSNQSLVYEDIVYDVPTFSLRGGFYSSAQSVTLSTDFGGSIRYTTDGSEPDPNSVLYSTPLLLNETTILRARIFKSGLIPGPSITQSYFINENTVDEKLPLVSIATNPENFWDPEVGIYVQDFKPDWEIPVNIELFENDGGDRAAFNQMAGVKVNGLYSWQLPQKMLGVYFRKAYGTGNLDYKIVDQRTRKSYKSFSLRASGSDWSYTLFRDVLGQHTTLANMKLDIMGFKPAVVYVNGEYLGIHNIREKVDADYIEKSYNLEAGTFDLIENQDYPEAGDISAYTHLLKLLNTDLSVEANFNAIEELVDIENFTDLAITEMAVRNTSINHNVMAWKPKDSGKWKWIVMDLDRGFFKAGDNLIDFYLSQNQLLLNDLFENQAYREYFAKRLNAQLFTSFNSAVIKELIDFHAKAIEKEIPKHIERWAGTRSSYGNAMPSEDYWHAEVCNLKAFADERPEALLNDLQNYGFSGTAQLSISSFPPEAGYIKVEGLSTLTSFSSGPFLTNLDFDLEAVQKPGFEFSGWYELQPSWIIVRGSEWKYLDNGTDQGSSWTENSFSDNAWNSGMAELGYGDDDENTLISYGGNSSNKYITTYFRKEFTLSEAQLQDSEFFIHLLKDDGAIVYLNGTEVLRANMDCGTANYRTLAAHSISGNAEEIFTVYPIQKTSLQAGSNILSVEVHQSSANSSDISFDLGLSSFSFENATLYSADKNITLRLSENRFLSARYIPDAVCMVPALIDDELTLSLDCSPYSVNQDIEISASGILTIEAGVEIRMPENGNIFVAGKMLANGTEELPIHFILNPDYPASSWGGISFKNTEEPSNLSYVSIEDASRGPNPVIENAAISAFNADLNLDHLTIEKVYANPIMARYSDIRLTNSVLHSEITGDLINVKYGSAYIANCTFTGNDKPDTDAIDYDEVKDGVIRNSNISGFFGFNSDAIDIGEQAENIQIDSLLIFNITDKGVSLGQKSSATIRNSIFINCNLGVAVKDSSSANVQNCIFYSNGNAVACFEKNIGLAGGNAKVINSILSNSSDLSYTADKRSNIEISYSLTDNMLLPAGHSNIYANPLFSGPAYLNFDLLPGSPGILGGYDAGNLVNLGTSLEMQNYIPPLMISQIFVNATNSILPEFIALYNPADKEVDISAYLISKGVTALIPEGTLLAPKSKVYITEDANNYFWDNVSAKVIPWSAGKLSDNGEAIQLEENHGIVIDYLEYDIEQNWPTSGFSDMHAFVLKNYALDNHFPENWRAAPLMEAVGKENDRLTKQLKVYPNPGKGLLYIENYETFGQEAALLDISGTILDIFPLFGEGTASINLSHFSDGIYFIKIGSKVKKIIILAE